MSIAALDAAMLARLGLSPEASRDDVARARLARLVEALAFARAASPFYRARTDWPDRPPASLADLARFPFTMPADLVRADPPLVAVSGGAVDRVVTLPTSGTTGAPKRLHFTAEEIEATLDFFRAGMGVFTRPGDRVAVAFPADRPGGVAAGLDVALRRLGATPLQIATDADPAAVVAVLRRERPDVVAGPPVRLLAAARLGAADGGPPIAVRAVLVSSDGAAGALKRALAELWGSDVHDHWGMTETGFGGAVDCEHHLGLHLREADLVVEIVSPTTGAPLPEGEEGEIVLTTLGRRAVPLVRYRTGDLARRLDAPCPCGSRLARLLGPVRRRDDAVEPVAGVAIALRDLDEALFALADVADVAATVAPGRLAVRLAAPPAARGEALRARAAAALAALPALAAAIADGRLAVEVEIADVAIFETSGKRRIRREEDPCASSG